MFVTLVIKTLLTNITKVYYNLIENSVYVGNIVNMCVRVYRYWIC